MLVDLHDPTGLDVERAPLDPARPGWLLFAVVVGSAFYEEANQQRGYTLLLASSKSCATTEIEIGSCRFSAGRTLLISGIVRPCNV